MDIILNAVVYGVAFLVFALFVALGIIVIGASVDAVKQKKE